MNLCIPISPSAPTSILVLFLSCLRISYAQHVLPASQHESSPYINATFTNSTGVDLRIWTKNGTRNDTAPLSYGLLFEDIAHSGDGGIYGELLRNRAFQGSAVTFGSVPNLPGVVIAEAENPILPFGPVLDGWYGIGGVRIGLDISHPSSSALQVAVQVDVPLNASGEVGIKNDGWWGLPVFPQTYNASFWVQTDGFRWNYTITHFDVSLRDNATDEIFVSNTVPVGGQRGPFPYQYTQYATTSDNTVRAPSINNSFAITFDAAEAAGQTLYFDLLSLFGETYNNRPNGLRKDSAGQLAALEPKFLRFPGGNNLEGYSIQRRWKWWETIGPLKDRPGRPGDWTYYNTDGLGLLEYLSWCEDFDMAPSLAVYAGFSLDQAAYDQANSTDANEVPVAMMQPFLQEASDMLEYCMGSASTYWGGRRAADGHPEPIDIPIIEIGNEDFFSHDYPARAAFMYDGLRAVYPNITYVYTAFNEYPQGPDFNITLPKGVNWDDHVYDTPSWFIDNFNLWDNWQSVYNSPGVQTSSMEYHVSAIDQRFWDPSYNASRGGVTHPRMSSAVAEAVFSIGGERNPNTFKYSCFAPSIQNANTYRGTPYNISFTADKDDDSRSVSYWQQQMFAQHRGTQTSPVTTVEGGFNPSFWVASIDVPTNTVCFKIVNAGNTTQESRLQLDVPFSAVNGTILEPPVPGESNAFNYFDNKTMIVPMPIEGLESETNSADDMCKSVWTVPAYSVGVLQFDIEANSTYAEDGQNARGWEKEREADSPSRLENRQRPL